jgi:hypothetical protein
VLPSALRLPRTLVRLEVAINILPAPRARMRPRVGAGGVHPHNPARMVQDKVPTRVPAAPGPGIARSATAAPSLLRRPPPPGNAAPTASVAAAEAVSVEPVVSAGPRRRLFPLTCVVPTVSVAAVVATVAAMVSATSPKNKRSVLPPEE